MGIKNINIILYSIYFHLVIIFSLINIFNATATEYASGTGTPFPIILNFFDFENSLGRTYESGTP